MVVVFGFLFFSLKVKVGTYKERKARRKARRKTRRKKRPFPPRFFSALFSSAVQIERGKRRRNLKLIVFFFFKCSFVKIHFTPVEWRGSFQLKWDLVHPSSSRRSETRVKCLGRVWKWCKVSIRWLVERKNARRFQSRKGLWAISTFFGRAVFLCFFASVNYVNLNCHPLLDQKCRAFSVPCMFGPLLCLFRQHVRFHYSLRDISVKWPLESS